MTLSRRHRLLARSVVTAVFASLLLSPAAQAVEPTFTFKGGGWGHGIGLSQYGALGYAKQGWSYDRILEHYYQATTIKTMSAQTVRVNLDMKAYARTQWHIQSGTTKALEIRQLSDSKKSLAVPASTSVWIMTKSGNTRVVANKQVTVKKPDGSTATEMRPDTTKILKEFKGACVASSGDMVRIITASGPYARTSQTWRGTLHFTPDGTTTSKCVNYVSLEQYLRGVVPCEVGSSWHAEALKAQAVAARSYAYPAARAGQNIYCTTMSQVYGGVKFEKSTTDAAIKATAGKVVYYDDPDDDAPGRVVQTFFFSSSGGHTANIEDVWTKSTPQPYYTGVKDADRASPHYTWTAGPYAASFVAEKLRARDKALTSATFTEPAPATLWAMSARKAASGSGYVDRVTLRWSNGKRYEITGDTLRSALGLRSTKFTIAASNVQTGTTFQDRDSRLAWSGRWAEVKDAAWSGGTAAVTSLPDSSLTIRFKGTGIAIYTDKGPKQGRANVKLDGASKGTFDLYTSKVARSVVLYSVRGLEETTHTVTISLDAKANPASGVTALAIDRLVVEDGTLVKMEQPQKRYEESHTRVAWLGAWTTRSSTGYFGGKQIASADTGAEVSLRFVGTQVRWMGSVGPALGRARVTIDGQPVEVDCSAASAANKRVIWTSNKLDASKIHTLKITPLSPADTNKAAGITVDRLDVTSGWALAPALSKVVVQETTPALAFTKTWKRGTGKDYSGGAHAYAATRGATAELRFEGTGIKWVATKASAYGRAEVRLDGKLVKTVDLYSAKRAYRAAVYSVTGLPARPHTLSIRVLGTKRAAATGTNVSIDAFSVNGRVSGTSP